MVDPAQPARYVVLGIECDGALYRSARDRLRQPVIEAVGWRLPRIWSTNWFRGPLRETERVVAAIEEERRLNALGQPDNEALALEALLAAAAALEREAPAEPAEAPAPAAAPYQLAELPAAVGYQELHLHAVGPLAPWVAEVVRVESSLHPDKVVRRWGRAAGAQQVGRRLRTCVDAAIALALRLREICRPGNSLRNPETPMLSLPRDCNTLAAASRKLALVAPEELAQAMLQVVRQSIAIEREAVASPATRRLGFARLVGDKPRQLVEAAVQALLGAKAIIDTAYCVQ